MPASCLLDNMCWQVSSVKAHIVALQGENEKGEVTDVFSFYSLPSSILGYGLRSDDEAVMVMTA